MKHGKILTNMQIFVFSGYDQCDDYGPERLACACCMKQILILTKSKLPNRYTWVFPVSSNEGFTKLPNPCMNLARK